MDEYVTGPWQIAFVVAVALGAGLFAFGGYLEPSLDATNPAEMMRMVHDRVKSEEHYIASAARGFGIGLMTLGGLGLVVPWINMLLGRLVGRKTEAPEHDAPGNPGV
jgi:hypothetical protein